MRSSGPKSGWDIFREEHYQSIVDEGYTGKDISSKLGEMWRKALPSVKEDYKAKAKSRTEFLRAINSSPNLIDRSATMDYKDGKAENTDSVKRRNSF